MCFLIDFYMILIFKNAPRWLLEPFPFLVSVFMRVCSKNTLRKGRQRLGSALQKNRKPKNKNRRKMLHPLPFCTVHHTTISQSSSLNSPAFSPPNLLSTKLSQAPACKGKPPKSPIGKDLHCKHSLTLASIIGPRHRNFLSNGPDLN